MPMPTTLPGNAKRPDLVSTDGSGSGTFTIIGNLLHFTVQYAGLSGPAIVAHIHGPASLEEGAGVIVDLEPFD